MIPSKSLDRGFQGERVCVVCEAATEGDDHCHVVRVVNYRFPDGTLCPYLEVTEPGRCNRVRIIDLSTAVHALLNLGEMEIFQIGNRETP